MEERTQKARVSMSSVEARKQYRELRDILTNSQFLREKAEKIITVLKACN